jgi:hypothetical protein
VDGGLVLGIPLLDSSVHSFVSASGIRPFLVHGSASALRARVRRIATVFSLTPRTSAISALIDPRAEARQPADRRRQATNRVEQILATLHRFGPLGRIRAWVGDRFRALERFATRRTRRRCVSARLCATRYTNVRSSTPAK